MRFIVVPARRTGIVVPAFPGTPVRTPPEIAPNNAAFGR